MFHGLEETPEVRVAHLHMKWYIDVTALVITQLTQVKALLQNE